MKKTLYSIMLNDEVVREVDLLAHKLGTNRSGLINKILAEYVNYETPEQRIYNVLSAVERLMAPSRELVPFFSPNSMSMSLKSSLEYKYRPTIKYEVSLSDGTDDALGTLSVIFRTQSEYLLGRITAFFRLWSKTEDLYLSEAIGQKAEHALYDGRFVRSILKPNVNCNADGLAAALSDYLENFDSLLKGYLSEHLTDIDIEKAYIDYLNNARIII